MVIGEHHLPDGYPPAQTGQVYFYAPGRCWVRSINGFQIDRCDWSPLPDYGSECPGCGENVPDAVAYRDGPIPFHWNSEGGGHTMQPAAYAT